MEKNRFNPREIIFSLDIGTRSIIGTVGIVRDKKFEVICERYKEHEERAMVDGQIHDINLVAKVVLDVKRELEEELGVKLKDVSIAAAGRFLRTAEARNDIVLDGEEEIDKEIVRALELSAVKKAEEQVNKNTDGKLYCVGYSVKGHYLNSYIISNLLGHKGDEIGAEVIATFLPRSVIDSLYTVMNKVDLKVINLTLEPIAAIEAAVPQNLRLLNIALVDIGAGTSDIAISSKESISAYAMVPMAGDEITELIAQEYLVDFNSAEKIKREIINGNNITYTDILGFENTIDIDSISKLILPTVKKIAEAISKKIIDINGGKSPSAVFLVGGGAHTPGILEEIAENLSIPLQRIAIKDRKSVTECISDNCLGSAGVTVLGIGLTAIRRLGNDFIDVSLNGEPVSLFNSHRHTVMDALLQAGINPALLMNKNGKNVRFSINGKKRLAFGEIGKNAVISINNNDADIEAEIKAGDEIKVVFAQTGKDASPTIKEVIDDVNIISIYLDDELINIEPIYLINGEEKVFTTCIKNGDNVEVFLPNDIKRFKKYSLKSEKKLYKDNIELNNDYILVEGDKITTININEGLGEKNDLNEKLDIDDKKENTVEVLINKNIIKLSGKKSYIFVDVFNFIDFDLTKAKGNIKTLLNGKEANYTDKLNEGDEIEVFWE